MSTQVFKSKEVDEAADILERFVTEDEKNRCVILRVGKVTHNGKMIGLKTLTYGGSSILKEVMEACLNDYEDPLCNLKEASHEKQKTQK